MRITPKHWTVLTIFVAFSGCSIFEAEPQTRLCTDENGDFYPCKPMSLVQPASVVQPSSKKVDMAPQLDQSPVVEQQPSRPSAALYSSDQHFVQLRDYTQQIAMELRSNMPSEGLQGSVIVTPFVESNRLIEDADNLGHDLADYLSHDLRNLGVDTSDRGLTAYLYRTERGGFEFSADQQLSLAELDASYVLAGSLRKTSTGLMVSAKVIELKSGKLLASSTKFLPNLVFNLN